MIREAVRRRPAVWGVALLCAISGGNEAVAVATLISCDTGLGSPGPFVPQCFEIGPDIDPPITDPEFSQPDNAWAAWQNNPVLDDDGSVISHGTVEVAPVDQITGNFRLDERVVLSNAFPTPQPITLNGPEPAFSVRGPEFYYSMYTNDEQDVRIGRITLQNDDTWKVTPVLRTRGWWFRVASFDASDAVPKIVAAKILGDFPVDIDNGEEFIAFDATPERSLRIRPIGIPGESARWLPGSTKMVYVRDEIVNERRVSRPGVFDAKALSFDPLPDRRHVKPRANTFGWRAPELGGAYAILSLVGSEDGSTSFIEVYRETLPGVWELWSEIPALDPPFVYGFTPEVVVFEGRSYVTMISMDAPWPNPGVKTVAWIATVDPSLPPAQQLRRIISAPGDEGLKKDAEPYVIQDGGAVRVIFAGRKPRN